MSNPNLAHEFADILNAGEVERFDDLVHPDYVNHNRYAGPGREGSRRSSPASSRRCRTWR